MSLPAGRVALLFSDIEGSTALLTRLGTAYGEVLDQHDRIMRAAFADLGGHEFSNEGDAFGAAFADPHAAVAAAVRIQAELAAATWPDGARVRVRMGVHYGDPKVRGQDYWGEDVHFAARVAAAAHGGQVVVSAALRAVLDDQQAVSLGHHGLKDFATPRELFQLVPTGQEPEQFPAPRTLSTFRSNLPSVVTPIIGRDDVLVELAGLFATGHRLVTITGAGGMGKTRTAIALGERIADQFPDGVAFVALAAVEAPGVTAAVASASGAPRGGDPHVAVLEHLQRRRTLLILDNCEHLAASAAELVVAVLERCPGVAILATAQLPLDLAAETVHHLEQLHESAVEMFVQRARMHDRGFRVDEDERRQLEQVCALLDGLPLAIVLAAARVRVLGVRRLYAALREDLDAVAGGGRDLPERQRSLRAALDWSLSLLTARERTCFAALGAFAESWSLEEAEQLLADDLDEPDVWDVLTRLMDASLVFVRGDGRFAMSQRVRQHAADLLAVAPTGDELRDRHAEVIALELHAMGLELFVDYRRQLANIVDRLPEARRALAWARERAELQRRIVCLMARALVRTGNLALVSDDLDRWPAAPTAARTYDDAALAFAQGLVHAMRWSTDTDAEVGLFDTAARGFAAYGDPREVIISLTHAIAALHAGEATEDITGRCAQMEQAAGLTGDSRWRDEVARGNLLGWEVTPDRSALDRIVADLGLGAGGFAIMHTGFQATAALVEGDAIAAAGWLFRALHESPRDQIHLVLSDIKALAWCLAQQAQDDRSVELRAGIRAAYLARTGAEHGDLLPQYGPAFAASEARLSAVDLAASRKRGAALSYDELVDRALEYARESGTAQSLGQAGSSS